MIMLVDETTKEQSSLILQLYSDSSDPKSKYAELHQFRGKIEVKQGGLHHKPYNSMLKRALAYRLTFLGLGALFFFLSLFLYEQSINWLPYSHIFSNDFTAKNVVFISTLLFSFAAFGMSFTISAEKEALHQLIKRSQRKLARISRKQQFIIESAYLETHQLKALKECYRETLDKTEKLREETKHLFKAIAQSEDFKKMVQLYNEALLELNDQLHHIINQFKRKISL